MYILLYMSDFSSSGDWFVEGYTNTFVESFL
jgi:hypothetical protein